MIYGLILLFLSFFFRVKRLARTLVQMFYSYVSHLTAGAGLLIATGAPTPSLMILQCPPLQCPPLATAGLRDRATLCLTERVAGKSYLAVKPIGLLKNHGFR